MSVLALERVLDRFRGNRRSELAPEKSQAIAARTILLIEDDPELSGALTDILVDAGFEVALVEDGSVGLSRMHEIDPDVVVLDLMCRAAMVGSSASPNG